MSNDYASISGAHSMGPFQYININLLKILVWANKIVERPSSPETGVVHHFEFSFKNGSPLSTKTLWTMKERKI